jgi:hypothetical protein
MTIYRVPPMGPGPGCNDFGTRWDNAPATWVINEPGDYEVETYRDTDSQLKILSHNVDAVISGHVELPHTWALDSELRWHIHVLPLAGVGGNVYWSYRCFMGVRNGDPLPAAASWDSGNVTCPVTAAAKNKHTVLPLLSIIPSGCNASTALFFQLTRLGNDDKDTYSTNKTWGIGAANLGIVGLGVHFQKGSPGTPTELA